VVPIQISDPGDVALIRGFRKTRPQLRFQRPDAGYQEVAFDLLQYEGNCRQQYLDPLLGNQAPREKDYWPPNRQVPLLGHWECIGKIFPLIDIIGAYFFA
jgi:hypothetical protein